MLTFDQCRSLTRLLETTPDRADEVSLFYNPLTGAHRLVVRELHRRAASTAPPPRHVIAAVTVAEVAERFGVAEDEARRLFALARAEAGL